MIKAICFDLDGVFFTKESFQNFKKNLPKEINDKEKVDFVLYKSPQMQLFKSGKMSENDFWDFVKEGLKLKSYFNPPQDLLEDIYAVFRDSYNVNKDVVDYVNKVHSAGYRTCICSNNFPTRIKALDDEWRFLDCFDVKVFSYEVGYLKPAKDIFKALITQSGVNPQEIAYSDDDETKMVGASELGINTFLYTDFDAFIEHLSNLGVNL